MDIPNQIKISTNWNVSKLNSVGSDLDDLTEIKFEDNNKIGVDSEPETFLDVINMDNYLVLERGETDKDSCKLLIKTPIDQIIKICLVCDAKHIEVFTGNSELCDYYRTIKGTTIEELSEMGSETYMHEISLVHHANYIEMKIGKSSDTSLYLFGLKICAIKKHQSSIPFDINKRNVNFENVECILKQSSVPLTESAKKALQFLKHSNATTSKAQVNFMGTPSLEMMMNILNDVKLTSTDLNKTNSPQTSEFNQENMITFVKSYLDVRLKELQDCITNEFELKIKAMEDRQNEKLDSIITLLQTSTNQKQT